ncbi:hypothetical protein AUP68_11353 [Ilyonectria robusta]
MDNQRIVLHRRSLDVSIPIPCSRRLYTPATLGKQTGAPVTRFLSVFRQITMLKLTICPMSRHLLCLANNIGVDRLYTVTQRFLPCCPIERTSTSPTKYINSLRVLVVKQTLMPQPAFAEDQDLLQDDQDSHQSQHRYLPPIISSTSHSKQNLAFDPPRIFLYQRPRNDHSRIDELPLADYYTSITP